MFYFSGKLDHLLEPGAYYEAAWFERELAAIYSLIRFYLPFTGFPLSVHALSTKECQG